MATSSASGLASFRQLDSNRSGTLNLQEFSQNKALAGSALTSAINAQGGGSAGAKKVFDSFDKNGNGSLTGREFADGLVNLAADSAAAVLSAQEQQNSVSRLAGVVKGGLYATLGASNVDAGTFAQNILAAYYRK